MRDVKVGRRPFPCGGAQLGYKEVRVRCVHVYGLCHRGFSSSELAALLTHTRWGVDLRENLVASSKI